MEVVVRDPWSGFPDEAPWRHIYDNRIILKLTPCKIQATLKCLTYFERTSTLTNIWIAITFKASAVIKIFSKERVENYWNVITIKKTF